MKSKLLIYLTSYLLLIITGCSQSSQEEKAPIDTDPSETESAKMDLQAQTFPPHQDFYNNLLKSSNCSFGTSSDKTASVKCTELKTGLAAFGYQYSAIGGLDYQPTKIPISSSNDPLMSLVNGLAKGTGLVFHYGFESNGGKIVYILSKGTLGTNNKVQYCPFNPVSSGPNYPHYLLLEPNGNIQFQPINQVKFETYTQAYFSNMRDGSTNPPSSLNPAVHSKMVYHEPDSIIKFYNTYNTPPTNQNMHLYLNHGSVKGKLSNNSDIIYHAPILTFGDANIFYELDNIARSKPETFVKKALDIGQLCPPDCGTTPCQ